MAAAELEVEARSTQMADLGWRARPALACTNGTCLTGSMPRSLRRFTFPCAFLPLDRSAWRQARSEPFSVYGCADRHTALEWPDSSAIFACVDAERAARMGYHLTPIRSSMSWRREHLGQTWSKSSRGSAVALKKKSFAAESWQRGQFDCATRSG